MEPAVYCLFENKKCRHPDSDQIISHFGGRTIIESRYNSPHTHIPTAGSTRQIVFSGS
jgi:hypothetical protein